jgi:hypothetical protein
MTKVCARWVPKLLRDGQMKTSISAEVRYFGKKSERQRRYLQNVVVTHVDVTVIFISFYNFVHNA